VRAGDKSAIIHANKTVNADRGYGSQKTIKVQHSGDKEEKKVQAIDIDDLSLEQKKVLLEMRRQNQNTRLALPESVQDSDD
jgi:hypothetical protein